MQKAIAPLFASVVIACVSGACASDGVSFVDRRAEIQNTSVDPFPGVDPSGDVAMPMPGRAQKSLSTERQRFVDDAVARLDAIAAKVDVFDDAVSAADLDADIRDDAKKAAADLGAEVVAVRNHVKDDVVAATDGTWSTVHDSLSAKIEGLEKRIDDLETQLAAR